jgi:hypothetical protein
MQFDLTLDEISFTLDGVFSVILLWRHNRKQNSLQIGLFFSSTPDLSFIFSSTPDLSILFTSEVLFLEYFAFYQHSTPVVSSNQILGILEVFNKYNYDCESPETR